MDDYKNMVFNKEFYIVMSNDLVNTTQCLSLNAARVFRLLISNIARDDSNFRAYRFSLMDYAKFYGITASNLYHHINRICWELEDFMIPIENKTIMVFQFVLYKNGCVYLRFSEEMSPLLLHLKCHYTQYQLSVIHHMKRVSSIRFYEMIWCVDGFFQHNMSTISIMESEIKSVLGYKKEYSSFYEFKRRVIEPALIEINELSNLLVLYSVTKKVSGEHEFEFSLHQKPTNPNI